ncbi:transcriptional regulator [Rhizobium wenxiniae]|nr:helix-turn-helix transcriptional regulator [Rhizobium wenxiniae]GGF78489.1 transcriptional regulator [Rhizobium wenxiniae]
MITAAQLRAARAMIGLSIEELAEAASVSGNSIRDAEASTGNPEPELSRKLKHALESRGIIFVATGQQDASGPGVRLHQQRADEGIRPQNLNSTNDD